MPITQRTSITVLKERSRLKPIRYLNKAEHPHLGMESPEQTRRKGFAHRNPYLNSQLTAKARENTLRRIRRSMQLLYDTNVLELGFISDGAWCK
jgi:hypothetical protein